MASIRSLGTIAARPSRMLLAASKSKHSFLPTPSTPFARFSTTPVREYAAPQGPPAGLRTGREPNWEEGESALDKAGRIFLMTEMARGMYVVLEQFFRPP